MSSISRSRSFTPSTSSSMLTSSPSLLYLSRPRYQLPIPPASLGRCCARGNKYSFLGDSILSNGSGSRSNLQSRRSLGGASQNQSIHGGSTLGLASFTNNSSNTGGDRNLKQINPSKTMQTIQGLQVGLKGAIQLIQDEIIRNQEELQGHQSTKQLHLQLKTLEYQLSRLESLEEEYILQQKLREGVKSMAYAYTNMNSSTSSSIQSQRRNSKKMALQNVRAGFRECTEVMLSLESQLQEFLGVFHLSMKGIQGFARLCPGDVYEITLKHGPQKWKTRTKVKKDMSQDWDYPEARVTTILGEELFIKAVEVKLLGKQVLLGNKYCEVCELFSAHPQLMTVDLNPSGSLKLNVVVQWDPLAQFYPSPDHPPSPLRKRRMVGISNSPVVIMKKHSRRTQSERINSSTKYSNSTMRSIGSSSDGSSSAYSSASPTTMNPLMEEIRDNLAKLEGILSDELQGKYPELEVCEVNVAELKRMAFQESPCPCSSLSKSSSSLLRRSSGRERGQMITMSKYHSHSNSSLNIESALEAFDFLDKCEEGSNTGSPVHIIQRGHSSYLFPLEEDVHSPSPSPPIRKTHSPTRVNKLINSSSNTDAAMDSGISSLTSTSSRSLSPYMTVRGGTGYSCCITGSEQLDLVLHTHVSNCLKLINDLGTFGPLKAKEKDALAKLQQQGIIFGNILHRMKGGGGSKNQNGLYELDGMQFLKRLWTSITQSSFSLCTTADQVAYGVEEEIRKQREQFDEFHFHSHSLAKSIALQILEEPNNNSSSPQDFQKMRHSIVSLYQFIMFLKPYENETSFRRLVKDVREEENLINLLTLPVTLEDVESTISSLRGNYVPTKPVFASLIRLLSLQDDEICQTVQDYLIQVAEVGNREILDNCLYLLESDDATLRLHSLQFLKKLTNSSSSSSSVLEEIVAYLAQTDKHPQVRKEAKNILKEYYDEEESRDLEEGRGGNGQAMQ